MLTNYIVPRVYLLPSGYDLRLTPPFPAYGLVLRKGTGRLICAARIYHEGEVLREISQTVEFSDGHIVGDDPTPILWGDMGPECSETPGFMEYEVQTEDGVADILDYIGPVSYGTYSASGRKSVLADGPMKYASPPVIGQIAEYGQFVDGQAVVRLDRKRDYAESIALINPYHRPILVNVLGHDGRKLPRLRVPPLSCRYARLIDLLEPDEDEWVGHVQLTATNRILTFDVKHSLLDPTLYSHFEHLDPFRAEATHVPLFQLMRYKIGWFLTRRGIRLRTEY